MPAAPRGHERKRVSVEAHPLYEDSNRSLRRCGRTHGRRHQARTQPATIKLGVDTLDDGSVVPVLVCHRAGYQNRCRLITRAKLRGTEHEAPIA